MRYRNPALPLAILAALALSGARPAAAVVINFDALSGPTLFAAAGNAQTLNLTTSIGVVTISGGVVLTNAAFLPADTTSIYGTAANAELIGVTVGTGFTNPIVITFPVAISNFFLNVLNGNTITAAYTVADNAGNSRTFNLAPNLNGGDSIIGFAAAGTVVTIGATSGQITPGGMTVDFFIDNLTFNVPLPAALATPEPASLTLLAAGLGFLAFARRRFSRT